MIICHCMQITDRQISDAISWMRSADPDTIITPGKIYRALGKAADCGGCMPLFLAIMRENIDLEVPMQPRVASRAKTQENRNEGRQESN